MLHIKLIVFTGVLIFLGITIGVLWHFQLPLLYAGISPFLTLLFFYILGPIVFRYSAALQRKLVFQPKENVAQNMNFYDAASRELRGCRNFYLYPTEGKTIGVWHILPVSMIQEFETLTMSTAKQPWDWEDALRSNGKNIVIYFHGNTGNRALDHRIELYKLLQQEDCHVIAFDYRGFGDSSSVDLSEVTVVSDGIFMFKWIRDIVGDGPNAHIFIWGHSLGTGISSHTVASICILGENPPTGLILESPFTNIGEAIRCHPKAKIYSWLPGFHRIFTSSLHRNCIAFKSDEHISSIPIPIQILHAVDDNIIPCTLGQKLHRVAITSRSGYSKPIYFKEYGPGHGHKKICRNPTLPHLIRDFLQSSVADECNRAHFHR